MKKGFTLAEVLITLAVIGITAVIVLPAFISSYQQKVKAEQNRTILYKLTKATDEMKSLGLIGEYSSTNDFVNVLKKHFKIAQVCSSENLENCWPTKTIESSSGKDVEVKGLTSGTSFNPEGYSSKNVGIVTADGTPIIMSYKDNCDYLDSETSYLWDTEDNKPVTNATTSCIAMIYDLNGKNRPNKSGDDVRLFNVATLNSNVFECYNWSKAGLCMMTGDLSYTPLAAGSDEYNKIIQDLGIKPLPSCGENCSDLDYWAGAMKKCADMDARLPTLIELANVASAMYDTNIAELDKINSGLSVKEDPFNIGETDLWSSETYRWNDASALYRSFGKDSTSYYIYHRTDGNRKARCVK